MTLTTENIYIILLEILISFGVFAIFFVIFINYFFTDFETGLLKGFIHESVGFYKPALSAENKLLINNLLLKNNQIAELKAKSHEDETRVKTYNKQFDSMLIKIVGIMIMSILIVCLFFILNSTIKPSTINYTYLAIGFFAHLAFIVLFELLFIFYVLPTASPVKLHQFIDKQQKQM